MVCKIKFLQKEFMELMDVDYETANKRFKLDEIDKLSFMHEDKFYKQKIFNTYTDDTLDNIKPILEFCESPEQHDLWNYFRVFTSSIRTFKNIGRNIRVLVKDISTNKYFGIFSIASDLRSYSSRDNFIGWKIKDNMQKLKYIININCCVGLQPMSYNYNIGKLLVALCYSKEVQDYYYNKYGHYFACVTTFSINGKSIQYDRMKPYLQYIGETKGYGTLNIPDKLYDKTMNVLKTLKDFNTIKHDSRLFKIKKVLEYLDIPLEVLKHGKKRGVYIGFTDNNSQSFLQGKTDTFNINAKSINEIFEWWKNRWGNNRYKYLKSQGKLKYKIELVNLRKIYNIEKTNKNIEKKKKELGEEEYNKNKSEYMKNYRESKKYKEIDISNIDLINKNISHSYIAGFIDRNCSIIIKNINEFLMVSIELLQSNPIILLYLQEKYGGTIHEKKEKCNKKNQFKWNLNGKYTEQFLNDIKDYIIIESKKIELALEFIKEFKEDNKNRMIELFAEINNESKNGNLIKPYDRISYEYIAGLVDAEGFFGINYHKNRKYNFKLSITQKKDQLLLDKIKEFIGMGNIENGRLIIYDIKDASKFLNIIKEFIVEKNLQLQYTLKIINNEYKDINELHKFMDIVINDKDNLIKLKNDNELNKKGKIKMKKQSDNVISNKKLERYLENNKKKSENMKGINNPNFGVERSRDHSLKIALGASLAKAEKRQLNDDQINEIRKLYEEKNTMKSISEKFNVKRTLISDIIHKKYLKISEMTIENMDIKKKQKEYNKEFTKNELVSKNKRKINIVTIIKIIKYKINNPKNPMTYMSKNSQQLFGEITSIDQIKGYLSGRVKLFEKDFINQDMTWEEYESFIK
jgi:hypothetical protein